ncbi:RNA pyrophosphohydrolase [Bosea psychrotolerans]|uniref:RNA pyrophosphohydrolase n=1 Tax=Bosea psychrotolerans TaxID=1871628 RepID=A0A2S4LWA7_9HYPH|nr:RNA pyrophosphohydrolase [Bosea psychrotolerans]POR46639.1 putative (di)nucleoside polyphosphate hydrolase [Bosea psychrotolerans]
MIASPPKGYRPCVGLALFNAQGLVFIGRRANRSLREHVAEGYEWQMPQGGIDAGETPLQAARRELQEETNVTSATLLTEAPGWLSYDLPVDIGKEAWRGRWRGQAQKWFAFRLDGPDDEINTLTPAGGHKAEFDAWRWEKLERTPALIIPFKREVYLQVATLFAPFAKP